MDTGARTDNRTLLGLIYLALGFGKYSGPSTCTFKDLKGTQSFQSGDPYNIISNEKLLSCLQNIAFLQTFRKKRNFIFPLVFFWKLHP
jgi:hypothetical protein